MDGWRHREANERGCGEQLVMWKGSKTSDFQNVSFSEERKKKNMAFFPDCQYWNLNFVP